jgi:2-oxoglutarate dehydrogenase E1 component
MIYAIGSPVTDLTRETRNLMNLWNEFYGPNAAYVLDLYERYQRDPGSVDREIRAFFDQNPPPAELFLQAPSTQQPAQAAPTPAGPSAEKYAAAHDLAQAIRTYGHFAATLDPLGSPPPGDPALTLETYGLTEADLRALPGAAIGGLAGGRTPTAWDAIQDLRRIYSGTLGHDYLQIRNAEERAWLREAAESGRFSVQQDPIDPQAVLRRLTQVEVFEHFLQRSFVGKTRFSIEGLELLIPLLDVINGAAAEAGVYHILIGMAHRGRLNILAYILNKPIDQILAEFKDPLLRRVLQNEPDGWRGDVKYHAGARATLGAGEEFHNAIEVTIEMAPNPSHLEAVNPVVEGMARAAGTKADQPGPAVFDPTLTLPVVIHGDAAFPGQGVVAETLNMYRLPGYTTGGTIHIIANNQIGFTTSPNEERSTWFASDLAKGFRIPIIHVNADDPEGTIMAARIAFAYRERFRNDFLIDLIGYRRLGHNEGDEPAFTQPLVYQAIEAHPTVRKLWADRLVQQELVPAELPQQWYDEGMQKLQSELEHLDPETLKEPVPPPAPPGAARKVQTGVPLDRLERLNHELLELPQGFHMHPRLARILQRRDKIFDQPDWPAVDWSAAEALAYATILADGTPIRLTGQDVERGTFSHRHAVLHDVENGKTYIPLQAIKEAKAAFEVRNSPLSEYSALGFEFGFNLQAPDHLVIWEAQYGDFINNAQTVIDEFVVSARDKWGQLPSLVILLPHGFEGQGPDHSSGRLERFLNLAVDNNLRVANCTTAANFFHLLRRQAALLRVDPLPLVVMTPKSLLRHPLVASAPRAFSEGGWQPVIDRVGPPPRPGGEAPAALPPVESIRRLILCSGKVYIDLITSEVLPRHPEVVITRLEQLAPFPGSDVRELFDRYPALNEILWVQEEPQNMGAWEYVRPYLEKAIDGRVPLRVMARPPSASPAEGSTNLHTYNQRRLVEQALGADGEALPESKPKGSGAEIRKEAENATRSNVD